MPRFDGDFLFCWTAIRELPSSSCDSTVPTRFVPRHHRQSQDNLVLDELPDVQLPRRKHAVDLVVGFRDLTLALRELQLGVDRDGNRERIEAALTKQLHRSSYRNPQTRPAAARLSPAQ